MTDTAAPIPKFPEQDENGVDLSLIRENLKLSPIERWRRARDAAHNALKMREAGHRAWERRLREERDRRQSA